MATIAAQLARQNYLVDVFSTDGKIREKIEDRFGIDLEGVNITDQNNKGDGYDLCIWLSDGSIPLLHARNNILHFQMPFRDVGGHTLITQMKLFRVNHIIVNSHFTKRYIDNEFGVDSHVLYPPVDTAFFKPKRKENIILYVGRFSQLTQSKHQDILIKSFARLCAKGINWKLILAGGSEVGAKEYVKKLRISSKGLNIEIIESPPITILKELYGKSKIFWSAAGFGEDVKIHPERMEHFGITVVEAMAAKVVPLAFKGGGHEETIAEGKTGFLWSTPRELVNKTVKLINDKKNISKMANSAQRNSLMYGYERFDKRLNDIFKLS